MNPSISASEDPSSNLSFLVVEPNHARRGEISNLLSGLGVKADMVSDEDHASHLLERNDYHAIMAHGLLPGFHSLQLAAALHTMSRSSAMPVVAAVLEKEQEVKNLWGEGGDFDEKMEWPLCPAALKEFILNCQLYHQALSPV